METARQPSHVAAAKVNGTTTTVHSAWHSPVPYLFGGLAAMLGLIAFALLILACSYWKLSGYLDGGDTGEHRDLEGGDGKKGDETQKKAPQDYEDKYLVIMAGELKPTFLATPILMYSSSSRSSSFGGDHTNNTCSCSCSSTDHQIHHLELQKQTTTSGTTTAADYHDHQTHSLMPR